MPLWSVSHKNTYRIIVKIKSVSTWRMLRISSSVQFSSVQSLSHVWLFATPWTTAPQASLCITNSQSLLKHVHPVSGWTGCHPTISSSVTHFSSCLPRIEGIRVFSNESVLCFRWPKYWSFSFSISPSNEYSGLICFKIAWFDLLAVQGTLKSLLQHHSSKTLILWRSGFFMIQLSHPYMTTGKTIA